MHKQFCTLSNGLTVGTVNMPGFETVALGAFVKVGSRYEPLGLNGISHFLEHMAFKGTNTRKAYDIAYEVERVGADINAYTSKDTTAYHVTILAEHTELALDIISDVILNSSFPQEELDRERGVIIQEMARCHDNPNHLAWDLVEVTAFPDQAYGRTILGDPEMVKTVTREDFQGYMNEFYTADNIILVCAGKVQHDEFVKLAEKYFSALRQGSVGAPEQAKYVGGYNHFNKDFEQATIVMSLPVNVLVTDPRRYIHYVASQAIGGGMSSPLFTEVREKRGLVYGVGCNMDIDTDHALFNVYAGTTPENLTEFFDTTLMVLRDAAKNITEEDLIRAKNQYKASMLMSLERPMSQASGLVSNIRTYGRIVPMEEAIAALESVTATQAQTAIEEILAGVPTLQMVGTIGDGDYYTQVINGLK